MVEARAPSSPMRGGRGAFVEDRGAAHPGGTAAPAALAKFEQVVALNWTWTLLAGGGASRFPIRVGPQAFGNREPAIPHVTQREALRDCWRRQRARAKGRSHLWCPTSS